MPSSETLYLAGEKDPVGRDLKWFSGVRFHSNLDDLPLFALALDERSLFRSGLVSVHVKIDFFGSRIAVVSKNYLLGGSHAFTSITIRFGKVPSPCNSRRGQNFVLRLAP